MIADHILRDLADKCGADVAARIRQTVSLAADPQDRFYIALCGVATAAGYAVGLGQQCAAGATPEQSADVLWDVLRPMIVMIAGGGSADFRKLLREAPKTRSRR